MEGVDRKLKDLTSKSEELGKSIRQWANILQKYIDEMSRKELETLEKKSGELQEQIKNVRIVVEDSSRKSSEELNALQKELVSRIGELAKEVDALHNNLSELNALLEYARLELVNAIDAIAHSIDEFREIISLKTLGVV